MLFKCDRDELLKYVTYAERIVSTRSTISIMLNILFKADNSTGKVVLSSTDFKVWVKASVNAKVPDTGSVTLNANRVLNILKAFPNGNIVFDSTKDNVVSIYSDDLDVKTKFKIKGLPSDDFPTIKGFPEEKSLEVDQQALRRLIQKTIYAVSSQEDRTFLNGILFVKKETGLKLVSTDGRRLGVIDYVFDSEKGKNEFTEIVPSKVLYELLNMLTKEGMCQIALDAEENQIFFKIDDVELVSNLLEGKFPNYEQVIPKQHLIDILLPANELYEAIKRVSVLTDEKTGTIDVEIKENKLTLTGTNPELGNSEDVVPIEYSGEPFKVSFNFNYMLDAIRSFDEVEIDFRASTSQGPMLLNGKDNESHIAVIMPVKVNKNE